ncbi:MAG: hypothetical protein HYU99_05740, partial [Deltaproteobacteria bacterium]|nr:hypothetical protein [Deltaproteobacteria bacterium]
MSFETFIALRYLKSKKAYRFLSFLSLISLTGICISVFSFTVIHSVMNGFSTHLREALVGFDAHLTIQEPGARRQEAGGGNSVESWLRARKEVASPRVASVVPVTEFAG